MTSDPQSQIGKMTYVRKRYPRRDRLRSGREIAAQLMADGDRANVLAFARQLPPDDLLYLRRDITDEAVIDSWLENVHLHRTITILAYVDDEIIGEASLTHNETDWTRHRGDIRVIVSPAARGEGLGRYLAEEIFVIAELLGLERLSAQMTHDQRGARAVFAGLGFEPVALLPGFVIGGDDVKRDLLVMAYDVVKRGAPAPEEEPNAGDTRPS